MSQQILSTATLPTPEVVDEDMGDIQYLCVQQFNGNVTRLEGDISAVTNTLTHTVAIGKDGYILVAKIIPSGLTGASSRTTQGTTSSRNQTEAKISANVVEIDRVTVGMATSAGMSNTGQNNGGPGSGYGALTDGLFYTAIGMKVTTGQVIEIENTIDNGNCRAQMVILEVDTDATPQIPPLNPV